MSATAADVADDRAAAAAAFLPPPMTTAVGVVTFSTFKDDSQLPDIMALMSKDLSEPYSIFTYRHFSSGFPQYCILVRVQACAPASAPRGVRPVAPTARLLLQPPPCRRTWTAA